MVDPENLKKMSKDEIIECCFNIADWGFNDYESWEQQSAVYGLLDLYKKQQKEIEELKEINEEQNEAIEEWVNGERINDIKHISKDKIRETIKDIEKSENASIPDIYESQKEFAIEKLKELLEENNND